MPVQFDLQVLGPPGLRDRRGAPIRFRTRKQLALLTYLHLEGRGRPLSRDALSELLWPEASPERGRHSLSQALLAIRGRLGADALTRREQDVQFLADLATDLDRLNEGEASGPSVLEPLLGLEDCAGTEFAHWVDAARTRIRGRARDALRAALKAARSSGDLGAAHRVATLLYGLDPLCADAVYALAERALLDGDAVMAVRLLKEQTHRAQAELGANPNPELAQLLRRLERGERPAFLAQGSALPAAFTRREVFVGREAELAQLEAIWERARSGGYQTCLITGAPGIGKSSLLRRFATSLGARAWPAFVVPCQEIGEGIPYAAVSELITALGRDPSTGGTDPHWLAEASRVSPGLRAIYPGIPDPPNAPTDSIRLRVAEAVLRMMDVVSDGGPMLVAFDDVHHMDPASREVLFLVTRRLDRVPVLILATSRPDGTEVAHESSRGGLAWAEKIALQPLDRRQATHLLDDLLEDGKDVDPRIRDTIIRLAQGNPYFVEMLLSDWKQHEAHSLVAAETDGDRTVTSWSPPETLRSAFERHYRELSVEAQHLLQLLAVAERALATVEIEALMALEAGAAERLVLEMLDRGIGRVEGGRVAFKNELQRAYVYYAMGEERRSYFHTRVAGWLAEGAETEDFQRKLEASHHYICARMPIEASRTALAGAELAVRRGAPGEAERALGALLRSCPQGPDSRVHLVMANALVTQEKFREAMEALTRWVPSVPTPGDNALSAQLEAEALHRGRLADDQAILSAAALAVSAAEAAKADLVLIRALQVRAEVATESGNLDDAIEARRRAHVGAQRIATPEARALAALTAGYCSLFAGKLGEAAATFSDELTLLRDLGLVGEYCRALNGLGMCYTGLGDFRRAIESFGQALEAARKLGDEVAICRILNNVGVAYHEAGYFESAGECYSSATALLAGVRAPTTPAHLHANRARLAMESGDFPYSDDCCSSCLVAARDARSWQLIVMALLTKADLHLAMAEPELAWPLVQQAVELAGERWRLAPDAGHFGRAKNHMLWATKGSDSQEKQVQEGPLHRITLKTTEQFEISAFQEWLSAERDGSLCLGAAARELVSRGLFGVLTRLLAIGLRFQAIPERRDGESSAQLVVRVFRPREMLVLPEVAEFLQQDGAPSHFA